MILREAVDVDSEYWQVYLSVLNKANKVMDFSDKMIQVRADRVLSIEWRSGWSGNVIHTETADDVLIIDMKAAVLSKKKRSQDE